MSQKFDFPLKTVSSLIFLTFLTMTSYSQLISVKSVPVAEGYQFSVFPVHNFGMGGVSIAVEDNLHDPFVNPAKGSRLDGLRLFSSPALYSISNSLGGARTLPLGAMYGSQHWFGGLSMSIQQLDGMQQNDVLAIPGYIPPQPSTEKSLNNMYIHGMVGRNLMGDDLSLAGSIFWADLNGLEGVEMLYPGSWNIDQSGDLLDLRLGLNAKLDGNRTVEALLLHNRFDMTHRVSYFDSRWMSTGTQITQTRMEKNMDRTNTWGLHVGYNQPVGYNEWQMGGILTVNYKWHPKIPNYELMNIPRDPGTSWAYNAGLGLSHTQDQTLFGIELIYEPIWSETWAAAESPVQTVSGNTIPIGERTVENHFRFSNVLFRMGLRRQKEVVGFQLGIQVRRINYRLNQTNFVEELKRNLHEGWTEWSPSWGLDFNFPEFQIHYVGRITAGTGQPGIASGGFVPFGTTDGVRSANFIVAPRGDLTVDGSLVMIHQVSLIIPFSK